MYSVMISKQEKKKKYFNTAQEMQNREKYQIKTASLNRVRKYTASDLKPKMPAVETTFIKVLFML